MLIQFWPDIDGPDLGQNCFAKVINGSVLAGKKEMRDINFLPTSVVCW